MKKKAQQYEKNVLIERQRILNQIKTKKLNNQKKEKYKLTKIEQSVKKSGGIVKSKKDIENLLVSLKTMKCKKEKLRDQLMYCKRKQYF